MTMQFFGTYTVTGSPNIFSFVSIPQTFTHLQIRIFGRLQGTVSSGLPALTFNNDNTQNNYSVGGHYVNGDGASPTSNTVKGYLGYSLNPTAGSFGIVPGASATASVYGNYIIDVLDYANTNKFKTWKCIGGYDANGSGNVSLFSGYWNQTTAITRLDITSFVSPYSFAVGSRIDLYGVYTSQVTGAQ